MGVWTKACLGQQFGDPRGDRFAAVAVQFQLVEAEPAGDDFFPCATGQRECSEENGSHGLLGQWLTIGGAKLRGRHGKIEPVGRASDPEAADRPATARGEPFVYWIDHRLSPRGGRVPYLAIFHRCRSLRTNNAPREIAGVARIVSLKS